MHLTDLLLPLALAATTAAAGARYTGPCADHLPARFHSLSYDSTSLFREQPKLTPGELECCSDENWRASGFCYFPGPNFPKKEEVVIRGTVPGREGHVGFGSAQVKENDGKMEMENGDMKANEDKKEQRDLVEVGMEVMLLLRFLVSPRFRFPPPSSLSQLSPLLPRPRPLPPPRRPRLRLRCSAPPIFREIG
jgi:hypothetical protein